MRIFNESKTKELFNIDYLKGKLVNDKIITCIDEKPFIAEQYHYETIKEYENGGKDVVKVIDVEQQEYIPAHEEIEDIQVFIPYTEAELLKIKNDNIIKSYKERFNTYYTEHEQKYRRLHSLNALCDDGSKPYDKLLELYKEAEEKRKQIQELGG